VLSAEPKGVYVDTVRTFSSLEGFAGQSGTLLTHMHTHSSGLYLACSQQGNTLLADMGTAVEQTNKHGNANVSAEKKLELMP